MIWLLFLRREGKAVWQSRKITTFPIPQVHASKALQFSLLFSGYSPVMIHRRRTWWVPRKERNEQICEVTSYHQDVKWHDESSFLSCGESIALNEIYQNIISGRQKHMYKNYTYVGVITPNLVIIIIYNKTKVNIIDQNYVKQLKF